MKRICSYLMHHPGFLTYFALVSIVLSVLVLNIVPILAVNLFVIGALIFLIEAVLYLKLGMFDTWSYIAAFCALLAAFFVYTRI